MHRIWSEMTPPSTPPRSHDSSEDFIAPMILDRYPQYATPGDMALSPIKKARVGHEYTLVVGLPRNNTHPLVLSTFYPRPTDWPMSVSVDDSESFIVRCGPHPDGLVDSQQRLVVKFRAVIDHEGQLILAMNGPGSRTVPFHHQLSFPSRLRGSANLCYEEVIQHSRRTVIFAGEIGFGRDGLLHYVSNRSGHFKPDESAFEALWDYLALHSGCLADVVHFQTYEEASSSQAPLRSMTREEIEARAAQLSEQQRELLDDQEECKVAVTSRSLNHHSRQPVSAMWQPIPDLDEAMRPLALDFDAPSASNSQSLRLS